MKYIYKLRNPEKAKEKGWGGLSHNGVAYKADLSKENPGDFKIEVVGVPIAEPAAHGLKLVRTQD